MIKPEQIPIEAVYAVAGIVMGDNDSDCLREAIAAAINAWPGMRYRPSVEVAEEHFVEMLELWLPQEKNDD